MVNSNNNNSPPEKNGGLTRDKITKADHYIVKTLIGGLLLSIMMADLGSQVKAFGKFGSKGALCPDDSTSSWISPLCRYGNVIITLL